MEMYQAHALESASGVELTIALYDGIIRFMHNAIDAVVRNDTAGRRGAVKRAMDIVVHLQATMDRNVGGRAGGSSLGVLCRNVCAHAAGLAGEFEEEV